MGQPTPEQSYASVFILGVPGLWKATPNRYPCQACKSAYPIQPSTRKTIRDLKRTGRPYLVICYSCYSANRTLLEGPGAGPSVGVHEARVLLGLDQDPQ